MTAAPATAARPVRVLAYTRLSSDPEGRRAGHPTQKRAIVEGVEREGWPPIAPEDWFSDNDRSASKEGVTRPDWDRLLAAVEGSDRRAEQIVVAGYNQDRLMRQLGDLTPLANLLERKRGLLWTAKAGQVSISKGARVALYVTGSVAADESEKISSRVTDGLTSAAMAGKPHGAVAFGWSREYEATGSGRPVSKETIDPEQAAVVREMARRVLSGESLHGLTRDFNSRGVPAPGAGRVLSRDPETKEPLERAASTWNPTKIRQVLLRKANIGIRVYHLGGRGPDGEVAEYPAAWDAILDEATYVQVCSVLSAPERRTSRSNVAVHLLSGIAICGKEGCGRVVTAQKTHSSGRGSYNCYRCVHSHCVKSEARTDAIVEQAIQELLRSPTLREAYANSADDATAEARDTEAAAQVQLAALEAEYGREGTDLDMGEYLRLRAPLKARITECKAVLNRRSDRPVYADLMTMAPEQIDEAWETIPLDRRRAIVAALVTVTLHPNTKRGRAAFDPATVDVRWRGAAR